MDREDTVNALALSGIPDSVKDWIFETKEGSKKASVKISEEKKQ
mgnify:CR=1 FL=1